MTKSCFEAFSARILQCGVASGFLQKVSLEMIWTCSYVDVAAKDMETFICIFWNPYAES